MSEINLKPEERHLIELIREVGYGEVIITVKRGVPMFASKIREDVKLDQAENGRR